MKKHKNHTKSSFFSLFSPTELYTLHQKSEKFSKN